MHSLRHWFTHNWILKAFSLILALMLWMTVARETSSEIGIEVPLEYRNIPPQLEITGDATNMVEVRIRGSSNLIREVSPRDVSTTIDLGGLKPGERIISLTSQNVQVPFGAEVIRVNPPRVRLNLERTVSRVLPIVPTLQGQPADGFQVDKVLLNPNSVQVEGPESRVNTFDSIPTAPVQIEGSHSEVVQTADLDLPDPQLRVQRPSTVEVRVEIRPK